MDVRPPSPQGGRSSVMIEIVDDNLIKILEYSYNDNT